MSKIDLQIADNLEFEDGDIAITIKPDGAIGKVILPKMDLSYQMLRSNRFDIGTPERLEKFKKWFV